MPLRNSWSRQRLCCTGTRACWSSHFSVILLGVTDDGFLPGLSLADVSRLNQMISNVAAQHIRSPLTVQTESVDLEHRRLVADFCPSACYTYLFTVERFTHQHSPLCFTT